MKRLLILILSFLLLSYGVAGYCQELSISSKVDKERLAQSECLDLTITISGKMRGAPNIELPDLKEFEVLSKSSSQNISIERKKTSYSASFSFILKPKSCGALTIDPARIRYKGKTYQTQPIVVEVIPGEPTPEKPSPPEEPKLPELEGGIII